MSLVEKYTKSPEAVRDFQAGRLVMEITELMCEVMEREKITETELASRLGKTRPYVKKLLDGSTEMTVQVVADVFAALGRSLRVVDQPLSVFTPRLAVAEISHEPDLVQPDELRLTIPGNNPVVIETTVHPPSR